MKKPYNKKPYKCKGNDRKILNNLLQNPEGLRVQSLSKYCDLKSVTVYKRLGIMKKNRIVENTNPIWKIPNGRSGFCIKLIGDENVFELHNVSYIVKLLRTPDWWNKRKNYLIKLKEWQFKEVNFGKANSNPYVQLLNENFVIQCYPESLIIMARKRYYSDSPYETSIKAINDILDILEWFCERFRFNFWCNGIPHLEVRNNDFNRLNDAIANKVKEEKGKFLVEIDERRKVWVDMSEPFGKEANYPNGQEKMEKITKDYLTKEVLLPSEMQKLISETAQQISEVTKNQTVFAENMVSHVKAVQNLGNSVKNLSKTIRGLKVENKDLKLKIDKQKTLGEYGRRR